MPIKPENKARYPSHWSSIRQAILERAKHQCEQCGVANRTTIRRGIEADVDTYLTEAE